MDNKVKIEQGTFDDPLKVRLRGSLATFGLILLMIIAMNTCSTQVYIRENKEIDNKRLELAKKQYTLDSLHFEYMKQRQK